MSHSTCCGFTWMRRTARSWIGRVKWIGFVGCYSSLERHFPHPQRCTDRLREYPCPCGGGFLRESATICDPDSHGAIDATFFDRETASRHSQHRSDRHIRTLKTTALVDTDSCAILDPHCSAHWPHDTQTGRRVALRNTEKIEGLAGDKGYDDQSLRDTL